MKHTDVLRLLAWSSCIICAIRCEFQGTPFDCANVTCPSECQCVRGKAKCTNNENLDYIPKFPDDITRVVLERIKLPVINVTTLRNLTCIPLRSLALTNNGIHTLTEDAFKDLESLKEIKIQTENISGDAVSKALYSLSDSIMTVQLVNLSWSEKKIPDYKSLFYGLKNKNVSEISLERNSFTNVSGEMFSFLTKLRVLNLNRNYLQFYNFTGLERVEKLNLSHNWFTRVPNFCDYNLSNLKHLSMKFSKIVVLGALNCLDTLTYLNLNGLPISVIHTNTFINLTSLKTLYFSHGGCQLRKIHSDAFRSSSLTSLIFRSNDFTFSESSVDVNTIFKHTENLELLDLSYNKLKMDGETFLKMLRPLKRLRSLKLEYLQLSYLAGGIFSTFTNLTSLDLKSNYIWTWNGPEIFGNLTSLRNLDVSNNRISVINESSFPANVLDGLNNLDLVNNSFSCSCGEVKWFWEWLLKRAVNSTHIKIKHIKDYKCTYPKALYGKAIIELKYKDICPISETLKHILIIVSSTVLFICAILTSIYIFRWHIRYCIYSLRMRRKGYKRISASCLEYDAYVIYADDDRGFVINTLIPKLEQEHGLSICIRDRDFELGTIMLNEMIEKMTQCKKIILILSNEFARCSLCNFQLTMAQHRLVMERNNMLIVVLLQNVSHRYLNTSLLVLLTSTPHISWSEGETGGALFWTQIIKAVTGQNHASDDQHINVPNTCT